MPCKMNKKTSQYAKILQHRTPNARADIQGESGACGTVSFYKTMGGTLVVAEMTGLPHTGIFAFHIHAGSNCVDPGAHYNPQNRPHPWHAGDMPPLFSNHGYAWSAFLTDRFSVNEVLGRTVVIHSGADDFTSQPAGNAGARMACGVIQKI